MRSAISVRLPDKLVSKLSDIAKETERSKSFHIQKALELYLAEQADLQVAYDRLSDINDPLISVNDMREELDL